MSSRVEINCSACFSPKRGIYEIKAEEGKNLAWQLPPM